jgi:opacity protein-like surface antigen
MRDPGQVETIEFGSIGAGRYITPSIRVELQVELSTKAEIGTGTSTFTSFLSGPGQSINVTDPLGNTVSVPTTDTKFYNVTRTEDVEFEQDLGLINVYYDFRNSSRFTPYVGAGVGVSYRQLSRTATENAVCETTTNPDIAYSYGTCVNSTDLPNEYKTTSEQSKNRWDVVASLSAGLAYQVTDSIIWDTGYRYLWQNGGLRLTTDTISGSSTVEVKDIGQHQFRTGIRLDLN